MDNPYKRLPKIVRFVLAPIWIACALPFIIVIVIIGAAVEVIYKEWKDFDE